MIAIDDRKALAEQLDRELPRAFARTHGRLRVEPPLSAVAHTFPVVLETMSGLSVKGQLLSSRGRAIWPAERRQLIQRYGDAPAAELVVPTLPAFAASKTATWADRHAAGDLWDLWALNGLHAIDAAAADLYRHYGPTNQLPGDYVFETEPSDAEWQAQLAGQTRLTVTAPEAGTRHALADPKQAIRPTCPCFSPYSAPGRLRQCSFEPSLTFCWRAACQRGWHLYYL